MLTTPPMSAARAGRGNGGMSGRKPSGEATEKPGDPQLSAVSVVHLGPDTKLRMRVIAAEGVRTLIELRLLQRPSSSVDPTDFHPTEAGVSLPAYLAELIAEEFTNCDTEHG